MNNLVLCSFLLTSIASTAQDNKPHDATYYFERGEQAMATKEYFKAQAHYNECLRLNPRYAEAYRSRGIAREHLGELAKALTDYNIYVDLRPLDAEGLFSRAILRFEEKQYLLARQDFLKVLTLPGETNTVYFGQEKHTDANGKIFTAQSRAKDHIYNFLGMIETKLERFAIAISWLDSAIELSPSNASYWVNRGVARLHRGDVDGAKADYDEGLRLDPSNSLALHNMAILKSGSSDKEPTEMLLSESIEKKGRNPYPYAERAYERLQKNDLTGALEDYTEVVRIEPKDGENYLNRGLVKEKMKDLPGALSDFGKAIQLDSKNGRAWLSRGNVMSKTKRWKEAIEDYSVAINIDPEYGLAFHNRAIARQNAGLIKEACEDLKSAEKLHVKFNPLLKEKLCK